MLDRNHFVIDRALRAIRELGGENPTADEAKLALDRWEHVGELSDREYVAVLGWLGWTQRTCANCGGLLIFVTGGPQPGWWRHFEDTVECRGAVPVVAR
jgi:hypothetical protein